MQGNAVLFSEMTPDASWEDDFNDWYDHEHIPLRTDVAGFVSAQRYVVPNTRNYLAVYEMASSAVLRTPEYQAVKNNPSERTRRMLAGVAGFTRYIGEQIGDYRSSATEGLDAPYLYTVFFEVPAERENDFNDWYVKDHIPLLMECEQWRMVRRFRIADGEPKPWTHLALHYIADPGALESPARERARASKWRARLAEEKWFKPQYSVYRRFCSRRLPNTRTPQCS